MAGAVTKPAANRSRVGSTVPASANPSDLEVPGLDQGLGPEIELHRSDGELRVVIGVPLEDPVDLMLTANATEDFDDDGRTETLLAELEGWSGKPVRSAVRIDADGGEPTCICSTT